MLTRIYTKNGWVEGTLLSEGPKLVPDGGYDVPTEVDNMVMSCDCLYYDSINGLCCPRDDRVAWKVMRSKGYSGAECNNMIGSVVGPMRNLPDIPLGVPDPDIEPMVYPMTPVGDIIEVPGLRIAPFTHEHLDAAATLAIETGLYLDTCPGISDGHPHECNPPEAHAWMLIARRIDSPNRMAVALEYNGEPLQLEIFRLDGATATVGFTVHFTRERPHWFWREAEKPVFDALSVMGVNKLISYTRSDRPDWIQNLKDNYGATEIGTTTKNTVLEFPLTGHFQGWPQRKTAGVGWEWPKGNLIIREAAESDIADIITLVDATYPSDSTQKPVIKKMIDWWWNLDRASILIGLENGVLTHARLIRQRRDTVAAVGAISQFGILTDDFTEGMRIWQAAVGYIKGTMFVPEWMLTDPQFQKAVATYKGNRVVAVHDQFREPMTEIEWDCP